MKALITGIGGFVGPYLARELLNHNVEVFGIDIVDSSIDNVDVFKVDITNRDDVEGVIAEIEPDYVFHLAGFSSVEKSFVQPELVKKINVGGTKNLLDSIANLSLDPVILVVSSSHVYGVPHEIPIDESHPLNPNSPYAESRVEQERLCKSYKLRIIISRSFNHTGPGQPPIFVASDFAKQVAEIEKGKREPVILVGDLNTERDFSDVRDIVRAYVLAVQKATPGETYNICSGHGYKIRDILNIFISMSPAKITVKVDPDKVRPSDVPVLVGSHDKFTKQTGWQPSIPIEQTLRDILEYWRKSI